MTQTSAILIKIDRQTSAGKRVAWDKIPQNVVNSYEAEIAQLHLTTRGRAFRDGSTRIYNRHFADYGYTK